MKNKNKKKKNKKEKEKDNKRETSLISENNSEFKLSNFLLFNTGNSNLISTATTTTTNATVNSNSISSVPPSDSDIISNIREINECLINKKSTINNSSSSKYPQTTKLFNNFSIDSPINLRKYSKI